MKTSRKMGNCFRKNPTEFHLCEAVKKRDFEEVKRLITYKHPRQHRAYYPAILSNDAEMVEFLLHNKCEYSQKILDVAVMYGKMDCIKVICELTKLEFVPEHYCTSFFEVIRFIHENSNCEWHEDSLWHHVTNNSPREIINYMYLHGCPCYESLGAYLVDDSNFETVKYLHDEFSFDYSEELFAVAAANCSPEVLDILYDYGCPYDSRAYLQAFYNKKFENVIKLFELGCPTDQEFAWVLMEKLMQVTDF